MKMFSTHFFTFISIYFSYPIICFNQIELHLHLGFPTCGKDRLIIHSWNPFLLHFPASLTAKCGHMTKFQWAESKPKWGSSSRPAPCKSPKHFLPFSFSFYQLNEDEYSDLGGVKVGDAKRQTEPSPSITTLQIVAQWIGRPLWTSRKQEFKNLNEKNLSESF